MEKDTIKLFNKNKIIEDENLKIGSGAFGCVYKVEIDKELYAQKVFSLSLEHFDKHEVVQSIESVINEINAL